jgi:hypothetical protein
MFSLKYCLLSIKLINIKIEIWIICYSACSYIHYINLQIFSIKYNTNHKIHSWLVSISYLFWHQNAILRE